MNNAEAIRKILDEVKDTELRDSLLRELICGGDREVPAGLKALGLNPDGVRSFVGFQVRGAIIVHFILGLPFAFGGALLTLGDIADGDGLSFIGLIAILFSVVGFALLTQGFKLWGVLQGRQGKS
jgi:hypothetical protein